MRWLELSCAIVCGALFTAFRFFPGGWCEPLSVRLCAAIFVAVTGAFYLWLVDEERRPKVGSIHRIMVGSSVGLVAAAIVGGPFELFGLLAVSGALLGYIGFRWLKHVPL